MSQGSGSGDGPSFSNINVAEESKSYHGRHIHPKPIHIPESSLGTKSLLGLKSGWNTDNLVTRLSFDAASALSAAALICPIITIIDRYDRASSNNAIQTAM